MEQFKKRLEKLLSDSISLWRFLKLLFKILHNNISNEVQPMKEIKFRDQILQLLLVVMIKIMPLCGLD